VPNPASPRAAASPPAHVEWRHGTQPHRPSARGIQEHTQAQGVTRTTPLIPLQRGRPKIEAPKFEARRRPHPAGLTFAPTSWNRTSASRVRLATPRLDRANKGASRRYPVARRRQLPTGLSFCRPRSAGTLRTPNRVRTPQTPHPTIENGRLRGREPQGPHTHLAGFFLRAHTQTKTPPRTGGPRRRSRRHPMKLSPMTERAPNPTTRAHTGERPCPSSDHLGSNTCRGVGRRRVLDPVADGRGHRRVRRCRQPYFDNRRL
jgi:hypothetical protein